MKRYFRTTNATRVYRVGDGSVKFELVTLISGSWVGVYATDDSSEADAISLLGGPVTEIDEMTYQELKKKDSSSSAQPQAAKAKEEKKEKPAVVNLLSEIEIGKATYRDSLLTENS